MSLISNVGRTAICAAAAFFLSGGAGCWGADSPATTAAESGAAGDTGVVKFATYGISVTAPPAAAGWVADICPRAGIVGSWTRFDPKTHLPLSQIAIADKGKTIFDEGKQLEYAARYRGRLLDQKFEIDHMPATAIRKETGDEKSGPFLMLVSKVGAGADGKGGRTFEFDAIGYQEGVPAHDLIVMVKSVHWIPVEDALDHLGSLQGVAIFHGMGTVQLPEVFRDTSGSNERRSSFSVADESGRPAATIEFLFLPKTGEGTASSPSDAELARYRRALLESAQSNFNLQGSFSIEDGHLINNGITTTLGKIPSMTKADVVESYDRVAMWFGASGGVQVIMSNFAASDDAAGRWDKVLLNVVNSLSLSAPAATGAATTPAAATQAGGDRFKLNVP